jgi:hypothetical protein
MISNLFPLCQVHVYRRRGLFSFVAVTREGVTTKHVVYHSDRGPVKCTKFGRGRHVPILF